MEIVFLEWRSSVGGSTGWSGALVEEGARDFCCWHCNNSHYSCARLAYRGELLF